MSKLPSISTRQLLAVLRQKGFDEVPGRGKGSHHVLYRDDPQAIVTVPERKSLKRGTLRTILRQVDLSVDELLELL